MPRTIRTLPARATPLRAHLTGGNGSSSPDPQADRLNRIEQLLVAIQQQLDVQFQRIADLQVQIDRSIASQRKIIP